MVHRWWFLRTFLTFLQCRHLFKFSSVVLHVSSGFLVRGHSPLLRPCHPVCHPMEIFLEASESGRDWFQSLSLYIRLRPVDMNGDLMVMESPMVFNISSAGRRSNIWTSAVTVDVRLSAAGSKDTKWWMTINALLFVPQSCFIFIDSLRPDTVQPGHRLNCSLTNDQQVESTSHKKN